VIILDQLDRQSRVSWDGMPVTDVHQHLWPEPLLGLLAARASAPRLRRGGDGWRLELAGEPEAAFDPGAHDPAARLALVTRDGLERVVVAPSAPLGIESLPAHEAQPLLDAFHAGVREIGGPFVPWGSLSLAAADPAAVDALVALGAAGLCLPAAALTTPERLERIGPVLERLVAWNAPLFVHPGPAPAATSQLPAWWPPMTAYVSEMQAAWLAWAAWGRPAHPGLKVVWAMLAGAAPLQAERLAARGGPADAVYDALAWFDVSSYGPQAVDAMLRVVGVDRLVLGSDRPVADPPALGALGPAVAHAVSKVNPAALFA
jgi:6-methylsalicylate decarboxylase